MEQSKKRYELLDSLRGLTLVSMILYHAAWDVVYLFGENWAWYRGFHGYLWQQSICWLFILLSGFCWQLGKKPLRRGLIVFGAGAAVSLVTMLAMPQQKILFGILTLLGSCMLLMIPLHPLLRQVPAGIGLAASALLFALTRNLNSGWIGFHAGVGYALPRGLYRGMLATYLGFMEKGFFSSDYFSLLPWLFLFCTGYFAYSLLSAKRPLPRIFTAGIKPLSVVGRYSLPVYLLHQPVLYLVFSLMHGV